MADANYPVRLYFQLLEYCAFSCKKTSDMKAGELLPKMADLFDDDVLDKVRLIVTGDATGAKAQ